MDLTVLLVDPDFGIIGFLSLLGEVPLSLLTKNKNTKKDKKRNGKGCKVGSWRGEGEGRERGGREETSGRDDL